MACASLYYLPLGSRALWDPTEARFAEIAREMLQSHNWIVPHLNALEYLHHPPFANWLTALAMKFLGPTAFAARLNGALFGLLTLWLTYKWGENWKSPRLGLIAAALLGTSTGFFVMTQCASADMVFTFWMTLVICAGSALFTERNASRARRWTYAVALGLAGGVMTRGPVAILLPAVSFFAAYGIQGGRIPVVKRPWKAALILAIVLIAPWFLAVSVIHPTYTALLFISEFVGPHRPVYFYLIIVLLGFLPWAVFLPQIVKTWAGHSYAALRRDGEGSVLVCWIVVSFIFFSLNPVKEIGSMLPIFPALTLLLANEFENVLDEGTPPGAMPDWMAHGLLALVGGLFIALVCIKLPTSKIPFDENAIVALALGSGIFLLVGVWGMRQTLVAIGGVMVLQVVLLTSVTSWLPALDDLRSARAIAEHFNVRASANDKLVVYQTPGMEPPYSLMFYTGRPVEILRDVEVDQPVGTWGYAEAADWRVLKQKFGDQFQAVHQSDSKVLFRKER